MPKRKTDPTFSRAAKLGPGERVVYLHQGQFQEEAASLVFDLKNAATLIENNERNNAFLPPVIADMTYSKAVVREAERQRKAYLERLREDLDAARRKLAAAVFENNATLLRAVADVIEQDAALNEQKRRVAVNGETIVYLDRNSADPAATHIARWHMERRAANLPCTC